MSYHDAFLDAPALLGGAASRRSAYGHAAFATAVDDGLMPDEVRHVLAGRRMVDAFPVRSGESLPAYAERAVAEIMVAYLADGFPDAVLGQPHRETAR